MLREVPSRAAHASSTPSSNLPVAKCCFHFLTDQSPGLLPNLGMHAAICNISSITIRQQQIYQHTIVTSVSQMRQWKTPRQRVPARIDLPARAARSNRGLDRKTDLPVALQSRLRDCPLNRIQRAVWKCTPY